MAIFEKTYFVKFRFTKNGRKGRGSGTVVIGLLVSWEDVIDSIKEKTGADENSVSITETKRLD